MRENISLIVKRSLVFVGAFALAAAQPVVTLGAPPGSQAHSRPVAPAPHAAVPGGSANQGDFKVPLRVNLQPKPLTVPEHFTLQSAFDQRTQLSPLPLHRRYGWQPTPGYLWYPPLYEPACAANSFFGSPNEQQPSDFTLGSLVDGKSNLLSPPSHNAGFAGGNDPGAASSSPFTFRAGFFPAACGASSFTNL
jgi:hypothetical protein